MFFLYSLQGLTPLPIELPPSYLGLIIPLTFGSPFSSTNWSLYPYPQCVSIGLHRGLYPAFHPAEGR